MHWSASAAWRRRCNGRRIAAPGWRRPGRLALAPLLMIALALLGGCWLRLPDHSWPADGPVRDHVYLTRDELLIVSLPGTPLAFRPEQRTTLGRRQQVLATLKAGSRVRVLAMRSARLPGGVSYFYRVRDLGSGAIFDINRDMRGCLVPEAEPAAADSRP